MIDKLKEGLNMNIDNFHRGLIDVSNLLWKRIEGFLAETVVLVNQSDEMSSYKKLKNTLQITNDPIKAEIDIYNLRKQEATKAESLYKHIKRNYDSAKINQLKSCLSILIEPYNKVFDDENFNKFFNSFQKDIHKKLNDDQMNLEEKFIHKLDLKHIETLLHENDFVNESSHSTKNYGLNFNNLMKKETINYIETPKSSTQENLEIR